MYVVPHGLYSLLESNKSYLLTYLSYRKGIQLKCISEISVYIEYSWEKWLYSWDMSQYSCPSYSKKKGEPTP